MKKAIELGNPVGVKKFEGYKFLLPLLIPYLIFTFSMLIASFGLSFTNYRLVPGATFVAFKNYTVLFQDSNFWKALQNTLRYVVISVPLMIAVPFMLAVCLNTRNLRANAFFRVTFYYPQVIAVSIVAIMASYIFQPYAGLVNGLLQSLRLLSVDREIMWLSDKNIVWITIVIITVWRSAGYNMIIYLAGLQDIPDAYYEAADLEGAKGIHKLFYITIPCLSNIHIMVIFLQLIASFKVFSQIFLLTEGGPSGATKTYIQYLYETAFNKWQLGRGSAAAIILFLIILLVTQIQMRVSEKYTS